MQILQSSTTEEFSVVVQNPVTTVSSPEMGAGNNLVNTLESITSVF
jgi:hypothetical protein